MPNKQPLKKSLIGFEVELFTINNNGYIVDAADKLLKKAKADKNLAVQKECASNMIEIASYPSENIQNTMDYLLSELEYLVSTAEKQDILLLPLGCYPGKFNPFMRNDRPYKINGKLQGSVLGFIAIMTCQEAFLTHSFGF